MIRRVFIPRPVVIEVALRKSRTFRFRWQQAELRAKISQEVISWREAQGLTQALLAKQAGIQQPVLARIESGAVMPSLYTLLKIAGILNKKINIIMTTPLPPRTQAINLLEQHVKNAALRHHCEMVATAMQAYAQQLGADQELWYQTGLLHDLDWEAWPDEHPNYAVANLLQEYPEEMIAAIEAHAPDRTGKQPETPLDRYLFACDEIAGLMHAVSLMRPNGFADMQIKSVKKKLKDKSFAANVSREDIQRGFELIEKTPEEHIGFLIEVFRS